MLLINDSIKYKKKFVKIFMAASVECLFHTCTNFFILTFGMCNLEGQVRSVVCKFRHIRTLDFCFILGLLANIVLEIYITKKLLLKMYVFEIRKSNFCNTQSAGP